MKMSYYPPEADLVLLAPDESFGHLYPSSTCQSSPSIMYSPPLHHLAHRMSTTVPRTESIYSQHHNYNTVMDSPYPPPHTLWSSQPSPILQPRPQPSSYSYPPFSGMMSPSTVAHDSTLLPQLYAESRTSRSHSTSSSAGLGIPLFAASETSPPPLSRSLSPTSPDLRAYGFPNQNGTWSCAYPGCTSRAVFTRGCDLRKHHKRHTKSFFCRHADCPQSSGGGFSSKKDLARHEAKHNPGVLCEWDGCDRVFSRVDNMRDHVKRIHLKASRKSSVASS